MRGRARRKPGLLPITLLGVVAGCQVVGNFSERSTPEGCEGDACAGASDTTAGAAGNASKGGGGSTATSGTSGHTGGTAGPTAGTTHVGGTPEQPSDAGAAGMSSSADGGEGSHPLRGSPAPCPADPVGACSIPGQVCRSANGACLCDARTNSGDGGAASDVGADSAGTWSCTACPASRPTSGTGCDFSLDLREGGGAVCDYSPGVACQCVGIAGHWQCGSCPPGKPTIGASCGAAGPYNCFYSNDVCTCKDNWSCRKAAEPRCDDFGPSICGVGCRYEALDQSCSCLGCTCPAHAPQDGSPCIALDLAKPDPCKYANVSCTCTGNKWSCSTDCPASAPNDGDTCNAAQQCDYGALFCVCQSGQWTCG